MKTTLLQKTALLFFGLILCLVLLETGLRLGGWFLISVQHYGNVLSMERKGAYRILCLGESTTYGQYPHLLEQILNQRKIGVRFSVVDKGIPATNTTAILSRVEAYLAEYHPDMVVTMMGINDFGDHMPLGTAMTSKGAIFIQSLRTYKLASLLWLHLLTKAEESGFYRPNGDGGGAQRARALVHATEFYESFGKEISTEESFKKAGEFNLENATALLRLGRFYQERNEFMQAEYFFKKAIDVDPKNSKAYEELGWNYRHQDEFPQAEGFIRKAIELDPESETACVRLAKLLQSGKPFEAETLFKKAIELNPKDDEAYFRLGRMCRFRGELQQAKDFLEKAVELDPRNVFALIELGELYRRLNKPAQAEDLYAKTMAINPENDRAFGAMSSLLEETGRAELAKIFAENATRLRSESSFSSIVKNHRELKKILDRKGIKLVCVQYPMRSVASLKRLFEDSEGVVFVDNEDVFKKALKKGGYREYFGDTFGGDFGHCTQKGNELLARNIADVILREVFNK